MMLETFRRRAFIADLLAFCAQDGGKGEKGSEPAGLSAT